MFRKTPLNRQRLNRKLTILNPETLSFLKIAVSTIKECENASITAKMVICLAVNVNEAMAPSAAYKFKVFPSTSTIAASPGSPNKNITGLNTTAIQFSTGVIPINVTTRYTGTNTLDKIHKVLNPFIKPRLMVSTIYLVLLNSFVCKSIDIQYILT